MRLGGLVAASTWRLRRSFTVHSHTTTGIRGHVRLIEDGYSSILGCEVTAMYAASATFMFPLRSEQSILRVYNPVINCDRLEGEFLQNPADEKMASPKLPSENSLGQDEHRLEEHQYDFWSRRKIISGNSRGSESFPYLDRPPHHAYSITRN